MKEQELRKDAKHFYELCAALPEYVHWHNDPITPEIAEAIWQAASTPLLERIAQQQAQIDRLMLEYCPEEMTPEQIAEWEKHQSPVDTDLQHKLTPQADEVKRLEEAVGIMQEAINYIASTNYDKETRDAFMPMYEYISRHKKLGTTAHKEEAE